MTTLTTSPVFAPESNQALAAKLGAAFAEASAEFAEWGWGRSETAPPSQMAPAERVALAMDYSEVVAKEFQHKYGSVQELSWKYGVHVETARRIYRRVRYGKELQRREGLPRDRILDDEVHEKTLIDILTRKKACLCARLCSVFVCVSVSVRVRVRTAASPQRHPLVCVCVWCRAESTRGCW